MSSRREPLLWLQCLAIGAIPMEILLLRLVLAGADFGPFPGIERMFAWSLGVLVPAVLLWKRAPDWGSLLVVRVPQSGRSAKQRQFSAALQALPLKVIGAAGALPLLLILWWVDDSALLVADLSPLQNGSRLGSLLLTVPILALLLWQWQQLVQAGWLLIRDESLLTSLDPLSESALKDSTISFGLQLLNFPPLDWDVSAPVQAPVSEASANAKGAEPDDSPPQALPQELADPPHTDSEDSASEKADDPESVISEANLTGETPTPSEASEEETSARMLDSDLTGAVKPEQTTKDDDSPNLDREIADHDAVTSTDPESHHEQAEATGGEQSDPEQPS